MEESKVYFTKNISGEAVLSLYERLIADRGEELPMPVAVKLHSGEPGNQNFLSSDMFSAAISRVKGTAVECNTAYEGGRNTTDRHIKTLKSHGFLDAFPCEILDAEGPDLVLDIPKGKVIKKNYVGRGLEKYRSLLVLSHFKGHPSGGYGGALKQLAIGIASSYGKAYIHGAGVPEDFWTSDRDMFLASIADAAGSVIDFFDGRCLYINVMKNLSVDCDCCSVAKDPCMADIGILASADPVALDKACLDLIYSSEDEGKHQMIERIESRHGIYTTECARDLGIGSFEYDLIDLDGEK
jgi:uncharacterized Fe-S center protein